MGQNEDENLSPRIRNPRILRLPSLSRSSTNINSTMSRNLPHLRAPSHLLEVP